MTKIKAQLARAFGRTRYVVSGHEALIGRHARAMSQWLTHRQAAHGTFITACNPGARPCCPGANGAAHAALGRLLRQRGLRFLPACHLAPDPHWNERGFFVFQLSETAAIDHGRRFGQVGIVVVARGRAARLVVTSLT